MRGSSAMRVHSALRVRSAMRARELFRTRCRSGYDAVAVRGAVLVHGVVQARCVGRRLRSPNPDVTRLGGHNRDHGTIWTTTGATRVTNGSPKCPGPVTFRGPAASQTP